MMHQETDFEEDTLFRCPLEYYDQMRKKTLLIQANSGHMRQKSNFVEDLISSNTDQSATNLSPNKMIVSPGMNQIRSKPGDDEQPNSISDISFTQCIINEEQEDMKHEMNSIAVTIGSTSMIDDDAVFQPKLTGRQTCVAINSGLSSQDEDTGQVFSQLQRLHSTSQVTNRNAIVQKAAGTQETEGDAQPFAVAENSFADDLIANNRTPRGEIAA